MKIEKAIKRIKFSLRMNTIGYKGLTLKPQEINAKIFDYDSYLSYPERDETTKPYMLALPLSFAVMGSAILLDALTPLSVGAVWGISIGESAVITTGLIADAHISFNKAMEVFKETYGQESNREFTKLSCEVVREFVNKHGSPKINFLFNGESQNYLSYNFREEFEIDEIGNTQPFTQQENNLLDDENLNEECEQKI